MDIGPLVLWLAMANSNGLRLFHLAFVDVSQRLRCRVVATITNATDVSVTPSPLRQQQNGVTPRRPSVIWTVWRGVTCSPPFLINASSLKNHLFEKSGIPKIPFCEKWLIFKYPTRIKVWKNHLFEKSGIPKIPFCEKWQFLTLTHNKYLDFRAIAHNFLGKWVMLT